MLRIAVPNKGSLSEPATTMLAEAGYRTRRSGRELVLVDDANQVELFFLRPRDIAVYVGQGTVHAGVTGRDLLLDSGVEAIEHLPLGFARSTFRFAAPAGTMSALGDIEGKRVATSYDVLVRNFLAEQGINAQTVHLDGAVESSVQLGVADLIADVVETGSTLRAAGLETFGEPILASEAVLITTEQYRDEPGLATLVRRLEGVLRARSYVLVDYDIPMNRMHLASEITPGIESPTVSPLQNPDWVAVRAMVPRKDANRVMDELYAIGARAILVSSLVACRL
ncbi:MULTISPECIES: ATP phosphoribosyltransferase [unclassified Actinomyces]|uniref:ATP phosphoribosyltransferase n=1 Tax=unclassified Actinomyces TaxID=2609248 RepID=UPI00137467A4|nr:MULTISPECIES: ATP phosphoribosyltransferase [unclassified Actinomyces]MBW3070254.1 ATP phosphoribosyltransferase [Actinomyces sp. 594]NDR52678.1 ATP phosphoribosyltransferase [Actinomyces sp. 565]QHO90910.1 ATP phosphoribosyltransferase [Actinomyces sp. 432]